MQKPHPLRRLWRVAHIGALGWHEASFRQRHPGSRCVWPRCAESKKMLNASGLDSTNPKRWLMPR